MASRQLVTAKHVRERLGVGEVTLWRWRKEGTGPQWCKMGVRTMYDLDSLERFIEDRLAAHSGSGVQPTQGAA
jgi:predicted DNA-binding transcriptional regulator AlpA